jgi:hypothetical protein
VKRARTAVVVLALLSMLACQDEVRLRVKVASRDAGTVTSTTTP